VEFHKKILKNGLTVIHEKRDVPVTTVMLACRYGSAYETEATKGVAHFIEHLCFKGTNKRTNVQIAADVEKVGGTLNAFTHEEVTAYHVKLPSNHLPLAMDVIFDMFFDSSFPEEEVRKEAQVVCEEIKMHKDHPRSYVISKLKEELFKKPFGMSIAGTEKNVKSFSRQELIKIHRSTYCPENSILCVVGNNSLKDVLNLARKYSSQIESRKFTKPVLSKVIKKNSQFKEKRSNLEQANISVGFHFPHANSTERYSAEVFSTILGEGMSSRLFREVRGKRGLAYSIRTELDLGTNYGYLIIYAGTDKNQATEVVKACLEEFNKMQTISEQELRDAKTQLIGNKKVSSEESDDTAANLVISEIHTRAEDFYLFEEKINKVTLKDIKNLLKIQGNSVASIIPKE